MATVSSADKSAATAFLQELGAPVSAAMIAAVAAWRLNEGPLSGQNGTNNPWNIESSSLDLAQPLWYAWQKGWQKGTDGGRAVMFATFNSPADGARAAAQNLLRNADKYGYGAVIAAAQAGNAASFLVALGKSSWAGGQYKDANGVVGGKLLNTFSTFGFDASNLNIKLSPTSVIPEKNLVSTSTAITGILAEAEGTAHTAASDFTPAFVAELLVKYFGFNGDHVITKSDIDSLLSAMLNDPTSLIDKTNVGLVGVVGYAMADAGQTIGQVDANFSTDPFTMVAKFLAGIGSAFAGVGTWIVSIVQAILDPVHWIGFGSIILGIWLTWKGLLALMQGAV